LVPLSVIALQTFSGSHYEIGVQQGKAVQQLLNDALKKLLNIKFVKQMKPRLLPSFLFLTLAKHSAEKLLKKDIYQQYPKQAQRLKGIADGAEVSISTILLLQSLELLITLRESSYQVQTCTTIGFSPKRTKSEETIIAKNFDYLNEIAPYHLTCQTRPEDRYQTLGCTLAAFPGMIDGMNEHGLTVTHNTAFTTDKPKHFTPLSIVLQEMLETCENTDEAVKFLTHAKRATNALLTLGDPFGNIKGVEISSNHCSIRDIKDNQIINTNHYHTAEMQEYEIPHNAVFSSEISKSLDGIRVHESSEQRLKRIEDLLINKAKIDENDAIAILSDHGEDNKPSMFTICSHGEITSTLRSTIFYPNRKTIKVLYGHPCQNKYTKFKFK
jgi:predicted choloylglycine hydrolase